MSTQECPSCGGELRFASSVSVYKVCSYCGSMVVRGDRTLESIGQMAALPEDISPLQIGTTLSTHNRRYTLIGRYWMGWEDGVWTEWFMDDGHSQGWLSHAQGFFSVLFERPLIPPLETAPWPAVGTEIAIDDTTFRITDIKTAKCIASEGELPFAAKQDLAIQYADMLSRTGGCASLTEAEGERNLYVGANVDFDDLHFGNLRPLQSWTQPRPSNVPA